LHPELRDVIRQFRIQTEHEVGILDDGPDDLLVQKAPTQVLMPEKLGVAGVVRLSL
jgi:hypothetical protein